jgi:hypothetical protein
MACCLEGLFGVCGTHSGPTRSGRWLEPPAAKGRSRRHIGGRELTKARRGSSTGPNTTETRTTGEGRELIRRTGISPPNCVAL